MAESVDAVPFAETVINNASNMIYEIARTADGSPRDLDSTLAAGVLNAQSNLAVAAALMVVAQAIGRART